MSAKVVDNLVVRCSLLQISQPYPREARLQNPPETLLGGLLLRVDLVANRAALHVDDALEPVGALGRGGKPVDAPGVCALHDELKVRRRAVVALVADDEIVIRNDRLGSRDAKVVLGREGLERGDVDDSARRILATPDLADDGALALAWLSRLREQRRPVVLDVEELRELCLPLVDEAGLRDDDERAHLQLPDQVRADDGLAEAGRRRQHAVLVAKQRICRFPLPLA